MKKLLSLCATAALAFSFTAAQAADAPAKEPTAQQTRMKACNADAKDKSLKGDERKAFMKDCLSANKQEKQQAKMKTCNAQAKDKKGDERKAFMKECLGAKA